MIVRNFILDEDHNLVPEPDIVKWGDWWEANRFMADEEPVPGVRVATIFLGFDQNHVGQVAAAFLGLDENRFPPSLGEKSAFFETTVFREDGVQDQRRYPTYADAMKGHRELVDQVKAGNL